MSTSSIHNNDDHTTTTNTTWESATNDQAFRNQVTGRGSAGAGAQQATGELSNEHSKNPSSPSTTHAGVEAAGITTPVHVRWELEEDNSNNINNVSFLTSDTTMNNTNTNTNTNTTNTNSRRQQPRRGEGRLASSCSIQHGLHIWDMLVTLFWSTLIGYHLYYNAERESSAGRSSSMILLLVISCLLALLNVARGCVWLYTSLPSFSTVVCCCCRRGCCGLGDTDTDTERGPSVMVWKVSTHLTFGLGLTYGIVAVIGWFGSAHVAWCDGFGPWCAEYIVGQHQLFIPSTLTILSGIEFVRWIFLQGKLSSLSDRRRSVAASSSEEYYNDRTTADFGESTRHRPWWWNRHGSISNIPNNNTNTALRDPLLVSSSSIPLNRNGDDDGGVLSSGGEGGQQQQYQPSWASVSSWFSPRRVERRQQRPTTNTDATTETIINGDEEDVESVLDSLGEGWASRAEEDPYWWTR